MFSLSHIFFGLLAVAIGIGMLKYNYQVVGFTGRQDWIESKLGQGSTYFAFKIFSLLVIFWGILFATGLSGGVFGWLFSPLQQFFPTLPGTNG